MGTIGVSIKCGRCGKRATFHVQRRLDGGEDYKTSTRCVMTMGSTDFCIPSKRELAKLAAKAVG